MFFGEYKHSLDDKGRLTLPAKFREDLARGLTIVRGEEYCLLAYPEESWIRRRDEELERYRGTRANRDIARAILGGADDSLRLDKSGRVLIKDYLRDYARLELEKEVMIVGLGDVIELWNEEGWIEARQRGLDRIANRDEADPVLLLRD